jgi:hypothetical protein
VTDDDTENDSDIDIVPESETVSRADPLETATRVTRMLASANIKFPRKTDDI